MSPTKRALLIASPFQGLRGPLNDVETMAAVLGEQGFEISYCRGKSTTRAGILEAWRRIIDASSSDDTVVIYYSGHGGIVEDSVQKPKDEAEGASIQQQPWRYQFLVPIDFRSDPHLDGDGNDANTDTDTETETDKDCSFTGILDVELAHLLRATTDRTRNVTTILDCCHSGRMARDPSRRDAAASKETAWEYRSQSGQWVGLMTQALSRALRDAWGNGTGSNEPVSWRTTLLRVRELVNIDFPQQNPHVEGPDTRLFFSLKEAVSGALVLRLAEGVGIIQAGRVSGVREGNVYALMPFGAERPSDKTQIGTATVTHVIGLKARAELLLLPGKGPIPREGVLAFLVQEALYKWPATCPEGLDVLQDAVDGSKYLRRGDAKQDSSSLVEFRQDRQNLILTTSHGVQLASRQVSDRDPSSWTNASNDLVKAAEQIARAQDLQALTCEGPDEKLEHRLAVTFGTVKHGKSDRIIEQDGSGSLAEDDRVYISLKNNGDGTVYVSVFDINVAGKISLISKGSARGIELPPGRPPYVLGADQFGLGLQGLSISWPQGIPRAQPVNERLVLVLTAVDLRYLADAATTDSRGHVGPSSLERLAFHLATGAQRDMTIDSRSVHVHYDTLHVPFVVVPLAVEDVSASLVSLPAWDEGQEPHELRAEELPLPEEAVPGQDLPPQSPYLDQVVRGAVGAIVRAVKGIPPCVWVVNEQDEDILVVVSKYRPNLMLSGGGMTISTTGAGLHFSSTSFLSPACKKPLAARAEGKDDSIGVFPLWTRKEGFGVISIFKGPQKELCIENDRIPLGATAFFSNKPNLRIVDYEGKEVLP